MGIRKSKTPQIEAVQCEYWNTFSYVSQFHPPKITKNILNTGFNNKHNSKLSLQPSQALILIHCFRKVTMWRQTLARQKVVCLYYMRLVDWFATQTCRSREVTYVTTITVFHWSWTWCRIEPLLTYFVHCRGDNLDQFLRCQTFQWAAIGWQNI